MVARSRAPVRGGPAQSGSKFPPPGKAAASETLKDRNRRQRRDAAPLLRNPARDPPPARRAAATAALLFASCARSSYRPTRSRSGSPRAGTRPGCGCSAARRLPTICEVVGARGGERRRRLASSVLQHAGASRGQGGVTRPWTHGCAQRRTRALQGRDGSVVRSRSHTATFPKCRTAPAPRTPEHSTSALARIWRRLPLPVTRAIGAVAYRYLA